MLPLNMPERLIEGCMFLQYPLYHSCKSSNVPNLTSPQTGETRLHSIANQWPKPLHRPFHTELSDTVTKQPRHRFFASKYSITRPNFATLLSSFGIRLDISILSGCNHYSYLQNVLSGMFEPSSICVLDQLDPGCRVPSVYLHLSILK